MESTLDMDKPSQAGGNLHLIYPLCMLCALFVRCGYFYLSNIIGMNIFLNISVSEDDYGYVHLRDIILLVSPLFYKTLLDKYFMYHIILELQPSISNILF